MTLTDRDRKIVLGLIPLLVLVGYWFLLLAPKREEASTTGDELTQQESKRDQLQAEATRLKSAESNFATDYATLVKLGKAIPTSVDMPSLLVQLDSAARGTGIDFEKITAGERQTASTGTGSSSGGGSSAGGSGTPAAAPGGEKAGTGAGKAAEKAGEAKQGADARSSAAGGTTSSSGSGGGSSPSGSGGSGVAGLDSVPLEFTFRGGFFDLSDFFHRMKRFVHVANERVNVRGRLMVINGFTFKSTSFPRLEAQVFATVYLAPKTEGATAGATPGGPASPSGQSTPASGSSPPPSGPSPASGPPAAVSAR